MRCEKNLYQRFHGKERLGRAEFKKVFSEGKRCSNGILTVYFLKHETRKAGFVVRRAVRPVVRRNRLKRLLREIYRRNKANVPEDLAVVVIAGEKASGLSFGELEKSFLKLLKRFSPLTKGE